MAVACPCRDECWALTKLQVVVSGCGCVAGNNPLKQVVTQPVRESFINLSRFGRIAGEGEVLNLLTRTRNEAKEKLVQLGMNIVDFWRNAGDH